MRVFLMFPEVFADSPKVRVWKAAVKRKFPECELELFCAEYYRRQSKRQGLAFLEKLASQCDAAVFQPYEDGEYDYADHRVMLAAHENGVPCFRVYGKNVLKSFPEEIRPLSVKDSKNRSVTLDELDKRLKYHPSGCFAPRRDRPPRPDGAGWDRPCGEVGLPESRPCKLT